MKTSPYQRCALGWRGPDCGSALKRLSLSLMQSALVASHLAPGTLLMLRTHSSSLPSVAPGLAKAHQRAPAEAAPWLHPTVIPPRSCAPAGRSLIDSGLGLTASPPAASGGGAISRPASVGTGFGVFGSPGTMMGGRSPALASPGGGV